MTPEHGARAPAGRKQIDWETVEREYRAGQLSVREIGRLCAVDHSAILKRAKAEGWARNLAAQVREAAEAKLAASEATSQADATTTRETVEAAAVRVVEVVRSHRADISALRQLTQRLLAGLERLATGAALQPGDDNLLCARQGVIAGAEKLAATTQRLVSLERQAFGLGDKETAGEAQDEIRTIRRVIVTPGHSDAGGVPPAAAAKTL